MQNIRLRQIWRTRASESAPWRPVRVTAVSLEGVELQYLDMAEASESMKTIRTTQEYIRESESLYSLMRDAP